MKAPRSCLICGSARLRRLYQGVRDHSGLAPGTWGFLSCEECGSATVDPWPALETIPSLYPQHYTFKMAPPESASLRHLLRTLEWRVFYRSIYRERLRAFRRQTGLTAGRVLEVGCGSGLFLQHLARAGYDVEGVDPSAEDVAYGRGLGLRIHVGGLSDAELADDHYDAVLLFSVLEHVPDPAATLSQSFRILKAAGWLVLEVPVIDSWQATVLGRRWHAVTEAPRHLALPSCGGVQRLLTSAGFTDVRSVPGPLLDNAGIIALSLLPGATTARSHGSSSTLGSLLRRCVGAALVLPGIVLAATERLSFAGARAGTMMFCGRKSPR